MWTGRRDCDRFGPKVAPDDDTGRPTPRGRRLQTQGDRDLQAAALRRAAAEPPGQLLTGDATIPDRDPPFGDKRDVVVREATDEITDVHELLERVEAATMDADPKLRALANTIVQVMWEHQHSGEKRSANHTLALAATDLGNAAKVVTRFNRWVRAGVVTVMLAAGGSLAGLYYWVENRGAARARAAYEAHALDVLQQRSDVMWIALIRAGLLFPDGLFPGPSNRGDVP